MRESVIDAAPVYLTPSGTIVGYAQSNCQCGDLQAQSRNPQVQQVSSLSDSLLSDNNHTAVHHQEQFETDFSLNLMGPNAIPELSAML